MPGRFFRVLPLPYHPMHLKLGKILRGPAAPGKNAVWIGAFLRGALLGVLFCSALLERNHLLAQKVMYLLVPLLNRGNDKHKLTSAGFFVEVRFVRLRKSVKQQYLPSWALSNWDPFQMWDRNSFRFKPTEILLVIYSLFRLPYVSIA